MIEKYYKNPQSWDRIRACWLFEQIERYVVWLHDHGYAARCVHRRVPLLMNFAAYAQKRGGHKLQALPDMAEPFVTQWLRKHPPKISAKRTLTKARAELRNPIMQMLQLALCGADNMGRKRPRFPFSEQAPGFYRHLENEKGLTFRTREVYRAQLGVFEQYLQRRRIILLRDLTPIVLTAFVMKRSRTLQRNSVGAVCGVLRAFLRYAFREGLVARDLSMNVPMPFCYQLERLPRSIPWNDVQRMLEGVDRRSAAGKRDYAMLLLLVAYGLRSREVAALTLDDIDWESQRLRIPARKAGHSAVFPLSAEVGEAIIDYIRNGRPQTQSRRVFMRAFAPHVPCEYCNVSDRAGHYLRKAGVKVTRPGSHTLRHACVQRLVDARFPLKTIGDYIGHRTPDSTMVYTKIDVATLRELAVRGEEVL